MKKTVIVSIAALFLVACISGVVVWKINDEKAKKEMAALASISSIQENVLSLYKDNQKTNLADNINNDKIKSTRDLFAAMNTKELSPQATLLLNQASSDLNDAEKMFSVKQNIDKLFDKNGAVTEAADLKSSKDQLEALKAAKPAFTNELMAKINDAETQKEQISTASKVVDALFTSSNKSAVKESITQAEIDDAKAKVNTIKQDKTKESLLAYVQQSDTFLDSKIKAEAEAKAKAEAEAKAAAEAKAKAVADANKSKNNSTAKKSDGTIDLKDWVPYSGDPVSLVKYLASGDVIKYNGQYYASPSLFKMISNENVVFIKDVAEKK